MASQKYFISYASQITLTSAFHRQTFIDIQQESNTNNQQSGITGFLLFKNGKFFQYFEGDELACANLLLSLKRDKRHTNLQVISEGAIDKTVFQAWRMCCFDMDTDNYEFELEPILGEFNPHQWQASDVARVVDIFSQRHLGELPLPQTSYIGLKLQQLKQRHRVFLVVQLALLVLIAVVLVSLFI